MELLTLKPFVARTKDGDYFFYSKRQAQAFARQRNGFFDTSASIIKSMQLREVI